MTIIDSKGSDKKVKVSPQDRKSDGLEAKLVAGTGITLTKLNPGGIEQLEIAAVTEDPSIVSLYYRKCRIENGCVINMEVRPLFDHTLCFTKKVAC